MLTGMLCAGCGKSQQSGADASGGSSGAWQPTAYTADDLPGLMPEHYSLPHTPDADDTGAEALRAYNILLGYLENELQISYQLCDYYYVDFDEIPNCYVIKVVPDGEAPDRYEAGKVPENAVMLSVYPDGTHAESGVVPHLMARKWTADLRAEFAKLHPEWHLNTEYLVLDHIAPAVSGTEYPDIRDYRFFLEGERPIGSRDMTVNLILPVGTPEADAEAVFAEAEPLLMKYHATFVLLVTPQDDAAMEKLLAEEAQSGNYYEFHAVPLAWSKGFPVGQE